MSDEKGVLQLGPFAVHEPDEGACRLGYPSSAFVTRAAGLGHLDLLPESVLVEAEPLAEILDFLGADLLEIELLGSFPQKECF